MKNKGVGKIGAVFSTGSGFGRSGGGAELTQLSMLNDFAELCIVLPIPKELRKQRQSRPTAGSSCSHHVG